MFSVLSSSFPRIAPTRSYRDRVYGIVDVYVLNHSMWRRIFRTCSTGTQACYISNNAKMCDPDQFAIKMMGADPQDAYAAWWRQRQAYKARVAPPVRRMVRVDVLGDCPPPNARRLAPNEPAIQQWFARRRRVTVWGYQTCVAAMMSEDQRTIYGSAHITDAMIAYYGDAKYTKAFNKHKEVKYIPNPLNLRKMNPKKIRIASKHLYQMATWTPHQVLELAEARRSDISDLLFRGLVRKKLLRFDLDTGFESQTWCDTLRHLDLRGSPLDHSTTRDALQQMEDGKLDFIPKGSTMPKHRRIRGGGDLHYGNIGWWRFNGRWRTVCIDFGWHYVCNHVRVRCGALHMTEQFNDCI